MSLTMLAPESVEAERQASGHWADRVALLWMHRRMLLRVTAISLAMSLTIAFLIPKQYKSTASIMPPDQQGSAMMLAALMGKGGLGGLSSLAGGLFGVHSNSALFVSLLESGEVRGDLINRFHLQQVYRTRYRYTTVKRLASRTKISDDKRSGIITIEVEDTDPARARDLAQGYLDELNLLLNKTSTSSARQERIFIEHRLEAVKRDLEQAQLAFSAFSSNNSTIDIKEQTHVMVEAGARIQAELLVSQSGLQALRQIYGDDNIRVKETEARIATLQRQLTQISGSSAPLPSDFGTNDAAPDAGALYPPLRQLPRLAVPYADLYRNVRVQESVFELLTQQYEMARIEEAKDTPVISVIDTPGIAERKSFPPRLLLTAVLTFLSFAAASIIVILRHSWSLLVEDDPRKALAAVVAPVLRRRWRALTAGRRTLA